MKSVQNGKRQRLHFELIKNEDLNSKFDNEEIEEHQQFEYTLQDVKTNCKNKPRSK